MRATTACCCGGRGQFCKARSSGTSISCSCLISRRAAARTIFDAYVNYSTAPRCSSRPANSKRPSDWNSSQADRDIFFNERALATDLVPNRDVGFELHGDLFEGRASYAAGIFNGTTDGGNSGNVDFADDRAFVGRLFFQPFKPSSATALQGFGFGVAGSYETMSRTNTAGLPSNTGGSLPGYFTDGQQQFFAYNPADKAVVVATDEHWRLSPQGYYYYGPFGLLAEYVISDQKVARAGVAPFDSAHLQQHGLGGQRLLGVDGGGCRLHRRRRATPLIQSAPGQLGSVAIGCPICTS